MNKSNWTGRTHRSLNEAFGPYHSKNYKLPKERKERPILTALTGIGMAAVWFAAFWILGA